jgi:hypothetical protein
MILGVFLLAVGFALGYPLLMYFATLSQPYVEGSLSASGSPIGVLGFFGALVAFVGAMFFVGGLTSLFGWNKNSHRRF